MIIELCEQSFSVLGVFGTAQRTYFVGIVGNCGRRVPLIEMAVIADAVFVFSCVG